MMRTHDLAKRHGLSAQAIRNYERDGFIPIAERTDNNYRNYNELHVRALESFLAVSRAFGHQTAGRIMNAIHDDDLDAAFALIDAAHDLLARDRQTLKAVRTSITHLNNEETSRTDYTIGGLAHRLGVAPATLRAWERAGVLSPERDLAGYRKYRAHDVRDAELTHVLRRGHYPLERIATVIEQIKKAGGTRELTRTLDDWQADLIRRGTAMLAAASNLATYLGYRYTTGTTRYPDASRRGPSMVSNPG